MSGNNNNCEKVASHTLRCDCHCDYIFLTTQLVVRPMSQARTGECQLATSSSQEACNLILWLIKYGTTIMVWSTLRAKPKFWEKVAYIL